MKRNSLRRLGALVLALALTLTLVPPACAVNPGDEALPVGIELTADKTEVEVGGVITLTASVKQGYDITGLDPSWRWTVVSGSDSGNAADIFDVPTDSTSTPDQKTEFIAEGLKEGTVKVYVVYFERNSSGADAGGSTTVDKVRSEELTLTCKAAATVPVTGVSLNKPTLTLAEGASETLTAIVAPDGATDKSVTWSATNDTGEVKVDQTGEVTAKKAGTATVTATTTDGGYKAECSVTVTATSSSVAVTGVSLNKNALTLTEGASETLTATVAPDGATNKTVTWSVNDAGRDFVEVDNKGKVTAKKAGKATVTVTTNDGGHTASCEVTVNVPTVTGLTFNTRSKMIRNRNDPNPWELTVYAIPTGAELPTNEIVWSIQNAELGDTRTILELPGHDKGEDGKELSTYTGGPTVRLTSMEPGLVTVTARWSGHEAHQEVEVSGIVLNAESVTMLVGETRALAVDKMFGAARSGNAADVVWSSSDPSTVTVVNGELQAWKLGTAVITANKNGYTATCQVRVTEDEDAVIDGLSATTSEPLTFDELYQRINEISVKKTQVLGANDEVVTPGSPVHYITNVTVPVEQGTLYYNYDSESNTGAGVGATDRFVYQRTASILETLDKLYFVPRQGFNGTAEITFIGWAENGSSFSVTAKVEVQGSQGIRYKTTSGQPAYFQGSDFNAYCRARMGRDMSYVTFNLPQFGQGGLYYGYMAPGQYAGKVSTTTQYGRTGQNTVDDVCFVPSESFVGETRISFRCTDTAGNAFTGEVVINVTSANAAGETANVYQSGQWGQPVKLQPSLFNSACQATIGDTLAYVRFQLPAYDKGTLYYNYQGGTGSRVSADNRYYYSGAPGIGGVSFVPASNGADRVSIPYTGYGEGGTSFTGTLYITLGEEERTNVHYSAAKEEVVFFDPNDFNSVALLQMGVSLEYVEFRFPDELTLGELYYDYRGENYNYPAASGTPYYRTPSESWHQHLDRISFHAGTTAGSVSVPFTAYSAADKAGNRQSFQGELILQVGAASPADITLSGYNSGQLWLSSYGISTVCAPVMSKGLSHIRITGLPSPEQGRLYYGYQGFKTGIEVKSGDRFYCLGAPNIDQLSFVPRGGYSGRAEITYIGYSSDSGEQVSGKIVLNISRSTTSQLYNDMGRHGWAVDAVEFLSRNGTVQGVGGGRYSPTGQITKGDFALMLVRAFGFTASGTVRFNDVPADSYYAQAISVAHQLGIATGYNGYFEPRRALTRQEAMLMVYRALQADGHPLNNGLTADLDAYRDGWQIAAEARPALGALILMGVVEGDGNGTLRPLDQLNRAETASLLHRLMTL